MAGLDTGIGLIIIFGAYFQATSLSQSERNSNLARIAAFVDADCANSGCATDTIINCDGIGIAVVTYGDNRVWVVRLEERYQFCHIILYDMNAEAGFSDFLGYDCAISHKELADLRGNSFNEIVPNASTDPRWTCSTFAP
jgi:hypothetical protein